MALQLPDESVPARTLKVERRTWRLQIECPLGGVPIIEAFRQVVKRDENGDPLEIGETSTEDCVRATASEFMEICPDKAHLVADVAAAIDALETAQKANQ